MFNECVVSIKVSVKNVIITNIKAGKFGVLSNFKAENCFCPRFVVPRILRSYIGYTDNCLYVSSIVVDLITTHIKLFTFATMQNRS